MQLASLTKGFLENAAVKLVEGIRIDLVIARRTVFGLQVLGAKAQKLDEMEAIDDGCNFFGWHAHLDRCLTQSIHRAARFDAGAQGEDARDVHEQAGTGFLQVDGAIVVNNEIPDTAKRWHHL
ncbi:hypothetical protein SDC9_207225 [bioreactor metagenome]|uniref:Uncharacterized protein n=1 Tax=bioreactor metagenome TaxID=1076179 RepID=A0A645JGN2_9ZZZZ